MGDQNKSKNPLVEVIVLTNNARENLKGCLDSLKKTTYPNFKVSVVDQNSSDGTRELVKKNYSWVNFIENKVNNGFVGGNNQVLKKTKAKYCIMLNDDTEQNPSWITELVNIAEKDDDIAALQPKVLALRNRDTFEYAGAAGGYMDIYGYPLCRGRVFYKQEKDSGQYNDLKKVFWCSGVAMFVRTSVLRKIGYLDEDFFIYSEEIDLCWRMNLAGYNLVYVPKSVIYHLGSLTMNRKEYKFNKIYLLHRNTWVTSLKNYSFKNWWKVVPMKILLEAGAIASYILFQPMRAVAIAKANLWVLFHLGTVYRKNQNISKLRKIDDKEIRRRMINKSVILNYFLFRKDMFNDYVKNIKDFDKMSYPQ